MFRLESRPKQARSRLSRGGKFRIPAVPVLLGCILVPLAVILTTVTILTNPDASSSTTSQGILLRDRFTEDQKSKDVSQRMQAVQKDSIIVHDTAASLPSAKSLLTMQPPFDDTQIIKLANKLIKSPNTVVTGYFRVPSKYKPDKYDNWMKNMLSLQDAMVIFTQAEMVDQIKELRSHAKNRTAIIALEIDQLPYAKLYSPQFWQDQLDRDPEKKIHRSYQLFWIWLSKSWLTMQAIRFNLYDSDLFVWSDIGCFRDSTYNLETLVKHREVVPPKEMVQMAHHEPNPPAEDLFNDKYKHKPNFYHSGSQFAGYKDTWIKFHEYFLETIDRFLEKKMIIVEDQAILQSVCLSHPEICAYFPSNQVKDNHYFGLRHVLHHGGDYQLWRYTKA